MLTHALFLVNSRFSTHALSMSESKSKQDFRVLSCSWFVIRTTVRGLVRFVSGPIPQWGICTWPRAMDKRCLPTTDPGTLKKADLRRLAPTRADLRRPAPTCADLRRLAPTRADLRRPRNFFCINEISWFPGLENLLFLQKNECSAPSVGFLEGNARERWQRVSVEHANSLESFVCFAPR